MENQDFTAQDFADQLNEELVSAAVDALPAKEPMEKLDDALATIYTLKTTIAAFSTALKEEMDKAASLAKELAVVDRSNGGYRVVQKPRIVCGNAVELEKIDATLVKYDTSPKVNVTALTARWKAGDREALKNVVQEVVEWVVQEETRKAYTNG